MVQFFLFFLVLSQQQHDIRSNHNPSFAPFCVLQRSGLVWSLCTVFPGGWEGGGGKKEAWLLFLQVCATAALRRRRSLEEDALSGEADSAADHVF